ncbi:uncharacterized protein LOC131941505 isoform X2 [Physella acuta]|uniref:uncharacterized protein LOC131941505 isoform X2 n=1 Tax=Physella acuta TaxID=109671 RepID=UPI0027DC2870|nr:uncharacterized protein LOC131941505 isoform X2 [Physella acuta]
MQLLFIFKQHQNAARLQLSKTPTSNLGLDVMGFQLSVVCLVVVCLVLVESMPPVEDDAAGLVLRDDGSARAGMDKVTYETRNDVNDEAIARREDPEPAVEHEEVANPTEVRGDATSPSSTTKAPGLWGNVKNILKTGYNNVKNEIVKTAKSVANTVVDHLTPS